MKELIILGGGIVNITDSPQKIILDNELGTFEIDTTNIIFNAPMLVVQAIQEQKYTAVKVI